MREYEQALYDKGLIFIAGVDEAGRGPLAGPVVAAAVVLPVEFDGTGVDDSKKLSPKKRESMAAYIKENALAYGFGIVDHEEIDRINVLEATKKAMKEAIDQADLILRSRASEVGAAETTAIEHILIDAVKLDGLKQAQTAIIKGDALSVSIAAASILAKVERDHMMVDFSSIYPGYGFEKHKGYGTKDHYEAIDKLGLCPIHRRSFLRKYA